MLDLMLSVLTTTNKNKNEGHKGTSWGNKYVHCFDVVIVSQVHAYFKLTKLYKINACQFLYVNYTAIKLFSKALVLNLNVIFAIGQCFSKCCLWTSSISIILERVKNGKFGADFQHYSIRNSGIRAQQHVLHQALQVILLQSKDWKQLLGS